MAAFGIGSAIVAIVSFFRGASLFQAAVQVAKFVAMKALLITLITTVAVVVFHNFIIDFLTMALSQFNTYVTNNLNPGLEPVVHQFSGIGGYLATKLQIVQSFSLVMSGLMVGVVRRFIPFVG